VMMVRIDIMIGFMDIIHRRTFLLIGPNWAGFLTENRDKAFNWGQNPVSKMLFWLQIGWWIMSKSPSLLSVNAIQQMPYEKWLVEVADNSPLRRPIMCTASDDVYWISVINVTIISYLISHMYSIFGHQ
jgi:hypothetical protein